MKITFTTIIRLYLVILMILSLLFIADRLLEESSRPVILSNNIDPVVVIIKKGPIFPGRLQRF